MTFSLEDITSLKQEWGIGTQDALNYLRSTRATNEILNILPIALEEMPQLVINGEPLPLSRFLTNFCSTAQSYFDSIFFHITEFQTMLEFSKVKNILPEVPHYFIRTPGLSVNDDLNDSGYVDDHPLECDYRSIAIVLFDACSRAPQADITPFIPVILDDIKKDRTWKLFKDDKGTHSFSELVPTELIVLARSYASHNNKRLAQAARTLVLAYDDKEAYGPALGGTTEIEQELLYDSERAYDRAKDEQTLGRIDTERLIARVYLLERKHEEKGEELIKKGLSNIKDALNINPKSTDLTNVFTPEQLKIICPHGNYLLPREFSDEFKERYQYIARAIIKNQKWLTKII